MAFHSNPQESELYNAWDEDIALVNIFFGKDTVMGEDILACNNHVKMF